MENILLGIGRFLGLIAVERDDNHARVLPSSLPRENVNERSDIIQKEISMSKDESKFLASMLLSGVGDALGYNDGRWEFCPSGQQIQEEVKKKGGLASLKPTSRCMIVSDDTVMHIATAEALLSPHNTDDELYRQIARKYKDCMRDMKGRAPGLTCMSCTNALEPDLENGCVIPFNRRGGGCGAAMRAVPIGLLYWRPEAVESLVRVAVEAGRMTHNHPTGFLGSVAVAVFVSYAVQGREVREWGEGLLHTLQIAKRYCEQQKRDWKEIRENWNYFEEQWNNYLSKIRDTVLPEMNPQDYDKFVHDVSYAGTGGASGHDAPLIAYDALLRCCLVPDPASRWETVCRYGMFHGGDSDSTGIIAGACYGAMFGLEGVPPSNYSQLEYRDRLKRLGSEIYRNSSDNSPKAIIVADGKRGEIPLESESTLPSNEGGDLIVSSVDKMDIGVENQSERPDQKVDSDLIQPVDLDSSAPSPTSSQPQEQPTMEGTPSHSDSKPTSVGMQENPTTELSPAKLSEADSERIYRNSSDDSPKTVIVADGNRGEIPLESESTLPSKEGGDLIVSSVDKMDIDIENQSERLDQKVDSDLIQPVDLDSSAPSPTSSQPQVQPTMEGTPSHSDSKPTSVGTQENPTTELSPAKLSEADSEGDGVDTGRALT